MGYLEELSQPQAVAPKRRNIRRREIRLSPFASRFGELGKFQVAGRQSEEMAISMTPKTAGRAGAADGTGGARPEAKRKVCAENAQKATGRMDFAACVDRVKAAA